jgi:predicted O-methyltransferase YrrM
MGLSKLIKRLRYPHKKAAVNYFLDDPRLLFGIPSTPTKLHAASFIERALDQNIIGALHAFLPQEFQDHLAQCKGADQQGYRLMLYLLVRKYRPEIVVETGVARGISSAYILCAMKENGVGQLYSIDLPAQKAAVEEDADREAYRYTLADGQTHQHYEIGYLVPEYLRSRWTLILEDARKALPELMGKLPMIDFFYHDSLHSYDHMKFEFETAWPRLRDGGLLLSDDVLWNNAFHEACKTHGRKPMIYRSFGMIKK